jgi:glycosyltransferase involved in cell wall biosynthesis
MWLRLNSIETAVLETFGDPVTLRVAVVGAVGPGGHALYCSTFAEALRTAGADVSLLGVPPIPSPAYVRARPLRALDRTIRASTRALQFNRRIRQLRPDILHIQLVVPLVDQYWVPRIAAGVPTVFTVHNVEPHSPSAAFHPKAEARLWHSASGLIVHTDANRRQLCALHPLLTSRVRVIPHGVWRPRRLFSRGEARSALGIPDGHTVVLLFGALRRNKGLELAIRALRHMNAPLGPPLLLVAGRLPPHETLDDYLALAQSLGVQSRVRFDVGFVPDDRVSMYYGAADVVALPYDESFKAQSGVLLETYGYERPVVVSNIGSLAETVAADRTGIVSPRTPLEFGRALAEASVPAFAAECTHRMGALASVKYDWAEVGRRTVVFYRGLITH